MPTAARLMVSDDPPALMNGRVMPVTGMSATTTPMLMNAWMQIQAVMPAALREFDPSRIPRGMLQLPPDATAT